MSKLLNIALLVVCFVAVGWAVGLPDFHSKVFSSSAGKNALCGQVEASSATSEEKVWLKEHITFVADSLDRQCRKTDDASQRRLWICFVLLGCVAFQCIFKMKKTVA